MKCDTVAAKADEIKKKGTIVGGCIVARLRNGRLRDRGLFPAMGEIFFPSP
jgi:hypothetical protein